MGFIKDFIAKMSCGDQSEPASIPGRNEACWCGSGKKYKKCHLEEDAKKRSKNFSPTCGSS